MTLAEVIALSSFFFLNCVMVVGDVGCVRVEGVDDIGFRDDWIHFFIIDVCDSEKPCINGKKFAMILLNRESLFGKYVL